MEELPLGGKFCRRARSPAVEYHVFAALRRAAQRNGGRIFVISRTDRAGVYLEFMRRLTAARPLALPTMRAPRRSGKGRDSNNSASGLLAYLLRTTSP
jgi:hypothetical protein